MIISLMHNDLYSNNRPHFYGAKDKNSIFLNANKLYHQYIGVKDNIIGKSVFDIKSDVADLAQEYYYQDRLVEKAKEPIKIINVNYFAMGLSASIFIKTPKYDNNQIDGTCFYAWVVRDYRVIRLSIRFDQNLSKHNRSKIGQNSFILTKSLYGLTEYQYLVIFLASLNQSSKDISRYFNVDTRAINATISRVKDVFCFVGTKKSLCEYLVMDKNLHSYVPESLLKNDHFYALYGV